MSGSGGCGASSITQQANLNLLLTNHCFLPRLNRHIYREELCTEETITINSMRCSGSYTPIALRCVIWFVPDSPPVCGCSLISLSPMSILSPLLPFHWKLPCQFSNPLPSALSVIQFSAPVSGNFHEGHRVTGQGSRIPPTKSPERLF